MSLTRVRTMWHCGRFADAKTCRFKKKLGLRASVKVATFDLLDDWEHGALTAHNITLYNPEGFSDSIMATMEFVKVGH